MTAAQKASLTAAINAAREKKREVRAAILAARPSDAPGDTAARRLRARLKLPGTVVVALPNGTQIASINVGGKRLAQAQALVANEGGYAGAHAAIAALTAAVVPTPTTTPTTTTPTTSTSSSGDSGGIATWIYVVIAVVVIGLVAVLTALRVRTRRVRRRGGGDLVEGARALLQGRLDILGEQLATTAVGVSEREGPLRSRATTVPRPRPCPRCARRSDGSTDRPPSARRTAVSTTPSGTWASSRLHLGQGGEPPRPESGHPARCFFNAEHGLATVEIELELPGCAPSPSASAPRTPCASRAGTRGAVLVGRRRLPGQQRPPGTAAGCWGQDDLPSLRYHGQPVFRLELSRSRRAPSRASARFPRRTT